MNRNLFQGAGRGQRLMEMGIQSIGHPEYFAKAPLEVPMMCGGSHCVSALSQLPVCFSTEHAGLTDDELAVAGLSIDASFCDLPGVSGNTTAKVGRFLPLQLNS